KYRTESRRIMEKVRALTPLVQPLSLDEAWMDLSGTERLHGAPPAVTLARLQAEIERDVGITVSIGLAPNKFLAKIASDLDKPRRTDFRIITRRRTLPVATQTAKTLFAVGRELLKIESRGAAYRLIGIGLADFVDSDIAASDFFAGGESRALQGEKALDALRL